MIAEALSSKGNPTGQIKTFSDQTWELMVETFGKNLRWRKVSFREESEISKEESAKIFGEEDFESKQIMDIPFIDELEELTKRELIEKYKLSEDLMKVTKSKIINEILK